MAKTKEQITLEFSLLEDEYKAIEKIFLENDDEIDPQEQKQLDKLTKNINKIKNALKKAGIRENKQAKKELKISFKKMIKLIKQYDKAEDDTYTV